MANYIQAVGNLQGLQLISTTTAAPPLQVSNTNLVSNLNVQYFNNQLSSYYTNASNISSGVLAVVYGGTGINSLSQGCIPFGQGSSSFGSTSNLFWNSTYNYLGIGTSTPSNSIDVVGNIRALSNIISSNQFVSTVVVGTPPFSISSTTLVSNLNVQYLSGQSGSYYTNATNINSGILNVSYGGTGVSSMTTGYIHFGSNSILGQTSNLFWNNTSNYLGVNTSTPSNSVDVVGNIRASSNIIFSNQLVSTMATGISPFSISSTTLVSNLNVQYLSGQSGSYYTNAININSGILNVSYGGTGVSSMTTGYIHFGSNSILGQTSNLFWNNTSNYLGVNMSTPSNSVDVAGNIRASSNIIFSNQLISTIATGISPLNITSTTLVSNLNVQFLNGQLGTYYTNASNISSGILAVANGGTGISIMSNGQIHFGSYGILGQTSNLFWNNTSNYLGVNNSNPQSTLDIITPTSNTSNVIIRGGLSKQLQIVPGTTISNNSNQASEIIFNWSNDWTTLTNCATIGINTYSCGLSNLGFVAPAKGLAMTLQSNGFLGIGTSIPSAVLEFIGTGISRNGDNQLQLFNNTSTVGACSEIKLISSNGTGWGIGQNTFSCGLSNFGFFNMYTSTFPMCITKSNYIGIGTNSPGVPLEVQTTVNNSYSNYGYLNSGGAGKSSSSYSSTTSIYAAGRIVSGNEFEALSDLRQKKNIKPLNQTEQIEFIKNLKPVTFQLKQQESSKRQIGFIAQDIVKTGINCQELVNMRSNPNLSSYQDNEDFVSPDQMEYSLNYDGFSPIIISVIQELLSKNTQLSNKIYNLKADFEQLKKKI